MRWFALSGLLLTLAGCGLGTAWTGRWRTPLAMAGGIQMTLTYEGPQVVGNGIKSGEAAAPNPFTVSGTYHGSSGTLVFTYSRGAPDTWTVSHPDTDHLVLTHGAELIRFQRY